MTDLEIYKSLECCMRKKCDECNYRKYSTYGCEGVLISDTLHNFGRLMRELEEEKTKNTFVVAKDMGEQGV